MEAAEEFVATFAENGTENTIWQRIAAAFRNFLRNIGFDLEYSDSELRSLLSRGLRNLQGSVVKENLTTGEGARFMAFDEQGQYFPAPDEWGTAYTSMTGKGLQAIEFLLEKKNGFVPAAFHRPEIGDIDIVYGKTGYGIEDKEGYGLAHISKRHPDIIWSKIVDTINNGKIEPERKGKRLIVSQDGKIILRINQKGRNWVISAFSIASTEELSAVNRAKGLPANLNPKGLYTIGDVLDDFKSPDEKNPEKSGSARHSVANDGGFRSSDPRKEELWARFIVKIANSSYINPDAAAALLLDHGIRITPQDEQTLVAACVIARDMVRQRNARMRKSADVREMGKKDEFYKIIAAKYGSDFKINAGPAYDGSTFTGSFMDTRKTEKGRAKSQLSVMRVVKNPPEQSFFMI